MSTISAMRATLRPYFAILRKTFTGKLQYRGGTWGSLITNAFWGCARAAILVAFYKYGSGEADLSMRQAVTMVWLQQMTLNLLPGFGMDWGVWSKVVRGEVAYELLRPLDLYTHWYANSIAIRIAPFLLSILPVGLTGFLVPGDLGMGLPASLPHFLAFLLTLATGLLISCAAICITYAMLMDVSVGTGPAGIFMTTTQILAGSLLPLQLWPQSMQAIMRYQPFAGMMDLPLRFYVGSEPLSSLPGVLFLQLFWAFVLVILGRLWVNRNLSKLTIQGG